MDFFSKIVKKDKQNCFADLLATNRFIHSVNERNSGILVTARLYIILNMPKSCFFLVFYLPLNKFT